MVNVASFGAAAGRGSVHGERVASGTRERRRGGPAPAGVLALQGDFAKHLEAYACFGVPTREVRSVADLEGLSSLTIPGGESTTLLRLIEDTGLRPALGAFVATHPVFGTCAGAILLGRGGAGLPEPPFGVLDAEVTRNAYGRQVDSFEADVDAPVLPGESRFRAVFIRAPRFGRTGPGVEIVARRGGETVGVRQGHILALAFHPELTDDVRFHRWFLETVAGVPAVPEAR